MVSSLIKRIFDFLLSFSGLLVLIPLLIAIGILIKLNDNGPLFFRQRRVGKDGKIFILYKFRTMSVSEASCKGSFEPGNNSRVTHIGKFLRRTKLDELPQLFNILKGEMSFVGPRPEVEEWVNYYPEKWRQVLSLKPGITDYASVEFLNEEEILSESPDPEETYLKVILPRKLDLCLDYINNHTLLGDIRIIFLTVKAVILR